MGLLVEGRWQDVWYPTKSTGGRFVRKDAAFRNWITADGSAGPTGIGGFKAEAGRYHLYVSLACPWAHRTLIMRMLKGLEDKISVSVVHWLMLEHGWTFADGPGVVPDTVNHAVHASDLHCCRSALHRPRHRSGTVGQAQAHHRQQRILRDHPDAEFGVRRDRCKARRLLPASAARRHRRGQCSDLRHAQQRRLQSRLRDHAGRL